MAKTILKSLIGLAVILIALFAILYTADTDPDAMFKKYGQGTISIEDGAGGNLIYRDQGPRDAEVLFLVHGSNASMQTWNAFIAKLSGEYRIISYDQHGHGLTGPHPKDDYAVQAKIVAALKILDHAKVDKAVWIGNSMGGRLTWRAALSEPDRVSKMVLIDASGAQVDEEIKPYFAARLSRTSFGQLIAPYITPRQLVEQSIKQNYVDHSKINDELIDTYWEMVRFPGNRAAIASRAKTSREPEVWNRINTLTLPTLLLWGEQDTVIPVSHGHAFAKQITNSHIIVYPNAGHLPQEETPIEVASDIRNWLATQNN